MWYSQTIDNAEENLTYIANSFIWDTDWWERFVRDFGNLYYPDYSNKNWQKIKRVDKFITENNCYVRAMSLWTSQDERIIQLQIENLGQIYWFLMM